MNKNEIINEEYDYDFLDYDYWRVYDIDPLWYCMLDEQYNCIRKAFECLDDNSKNLLDYFIIRKLSLNNIDIDIDKYLDELRYNYLYYYDKYYEFEED